MAQTIIFLIIAAVILLGAVLAVTSRKLMRAVTALIFVLFGVAGLYFLMGYTFLATVQLIVYAGGIVVLYVFAVMLTSKQEGKDSNIVSKPKKLAALLASLCGAAILLFSYISHKFVSEFLSAPNEKLIPINEVGTQLVSTDKYGYVLMFEVTGILLLACIVGALMVARKR